MFTGLVEGKGALLARTRIGPGARLVVSARELVRTGPLVLGESVSVDGACLTVEQIVAEGFVASASGETLERTTLGHKALGASVNLERALPLGGRMGGHIVSGHVDGIGRIKAVSPLGTATKVVFEAPEELLRFIAPKGSIAVNGVSLTVNGVLGWAFDVVLVPHTLEATAWDLRPGERVNLEVDLLARYVARLLEVGRAPEAGGGESGESGNRDEAWMARLSRGGYV